MNVTPKSENRRKPKLATTTITEQRRCVFGHHFSACWPRITLAPGQSISLRKSTSNKEFRMIRVMLVLHRRQRLHTASKNVRVQPLVRSLYDHYYIVYTQRIHVKQLNGCGLRICGGCEKKIVFHDILHPFKFHANPYYESRARLWSASQHSPALQRPRQRRDRIFIFCARLHLFTLSITYTYVRVQPRLQTVVYSVVKSPRLLSTPYPLPPTNLI